MSWKCNLSWKWAIFWQFTAKVNLPYGIIKTNMDRINVV